MVDIHRMISWAPWIRNAANQASVKELAQKKLAQKNWPNSQAQ